jgi:hypothetical protein
MGAAKYEAAELRRLRSPQDVRRLTGALGDPAIGAFDIDGFIDGRGSDLGPRPATFFSDAARDELLLPYYAGHGTKTRATNRRPCVP